MTASEPSSRSSTDVGRSGRWACGTLGRAHGLKGELYLDPLPHGVEYLAAGEAFYLTKGPAREGGGEAPPVRLRRSGGTDRRPLVRIEGVDTVEAAKALSGALVMAAGAALDEGEFFNVSELIGARAVCGGRELGIVTDVLANPAHDILQIEPPGADGEEAGESASVAAPSATKAERPGKRGAGGRSKPVQPVLIPFVADLVEVDLERSVITVREGLV